MGGRGAASYYRPKINRTALPYSVISWHDFAGRAVLPFAGQNGQAWHMVRRNSANVALDDINAVYGKDKTGKPNDEHVHHFTFGQDTPTLRWVNGSDIVDLFIANTDTETFLAESGLELSMDKGGFILSKRVSRIFRPQRMSGMFDAGSVRVAYMQQIAEQASVWDGAALVSRSMLAGVAMAGDLPDDKHLQLTRELNRVQRVEFTVLTERGQDKGHAIVVDDLRDAAGQPVDFLLPQDTKTQIKLTNGQTFVGFNPVHGHNDMRLDVQSLINLTPFFDAETLLNYVKDEGKLFEQSIREGNAEPIIGRIRGLESNSADVALSEVEGANEWPLRALIAAGGDPTKYRTHVKTLFNQHLERLNHQTLDKMRLPLPGGRHYVMPMSVAEKAQLDGMDMVGRGEIFVDDKRGTAWINDDDWLAMKDSRKQSGIAGILGGADHDDGLWLHGFTDYDAERKVLTWRSPNQVGEYIVLKPTANSAEFTWTTAAGATVAYPAADSRKLPQRIDGQTVQYLDAVDPDSGGGVGEDATTYTTAAMDAAIERSVANEGVLGMYCNALMLHQALYGETPEALPAPLEDVIDSAVKTGADVSQVRAWCFEHTREILGENRSIPEPLHKRLSIDRSLPRREQPPRPRRFGAEGHWLARLQQGVRQHIDDIEQVRDELMAAARPPDALFEAVANDEEEARVRGVFTEDALRHELEQESGDDIEFAVPINVETARNALMQASALLRHQPHSFGSTSIHIEREVVAEIAAWLSEDSRTDKNVAMLLEQAGMGKTVVMRDVLVALENQVDVLAIKADQQLSNIETLSDIQERLRLPDSAERLLSRLAEDRRVVVLIDQIDALSLSMAHDQSALNLVLDFLARVRHLSNVRHLISCRIFDRKSDPRLQKIDVAEAFTIPELDEADCEQVLSQLGTELNALSPATRQLLRIPLHLDLFARAAVCNASPDELNGIGSLQELYRLIWDKVIVDNAVANPSRADRMEVVNRIMQYMDERQRIAVPDTWLFSAENEHLDAAIQWMASEGILQQGARGWTFLHQTFLGYCFARKFVDDGKDIVSEVLASRQGFDIRPKLLQVIAHLRSQDHNLYLRSLDQLLFSVSLRFHLWDLLMRWFGALINPSDDEWMLLT